MAALAGMALAAPSGSHSGVTSNHRARHQSTIAGMRSPPAACGRAASRLQGPWTLAFDHIQRGACDGCRRVL